MDFQKRSELESISCTLPRRADGDVLMSRANTRELVGSIAIVDQTPPRLMLCDKLYRLMFDRRKVIHGYAVIAMRSRSARSHYEAMSNGASASMQNISQETVRSLQICLPELDQQTAIMRSFNKAMEQTNALKVKITGSVTHLQELRSVLITTAVTGQIDVGTWGKRGTTDRRLDVIEADMAAAAQPERQQARA